MRDQIHARVGGEEARPVRPVDTENGPVKAHEAVRISLRELWARGRRHGEALTQGELSPGVETEDLDQTRRVVGGVAHESGRTTGLQCLDDFEVFFFR
jgi:hypothetical protein